MENKLFEADQLLKLIAEEVDMIEYEQRKLQRTESHFQSLMDEKNQILRDLENTWQKGEMHFNIQETAADIKTYERDLTELLANQQEQLKRNISTLEEKESTLMFKRRSFT